VVVDFAGEIRVVLLRRLKDDFTAISEFVAGKVDLAKTAFADESSECVVADGMEIG